jgi:hypothetical protein
VYFYAALSQAPCPILCNVKFYHTVLLATVSRAGEPYHFIGAGGGSARQLRWAAPDGTRNETAFNFFHTPLQSFSQ